MINLILTLSMMNAQPAQQTAQFQPCVWPKTCKVAPVQTAQFRPCVWPNKCVETPAPVITPVAQFQPCVWPKTCKVSS